MLETGVETRAASLASGSDSPNKILAFYFDDPEGNMIGIYWPTRLSYGQPYGHPIDLTLTEQALLQDVADLAARKGIAWPVSPSA